MSRPGARRDVAAPGRDGEPQQLELMDLPRPLFAATPSRLTNFECPRRYWFTYLVRPSVPKGPPWAHNTVGAAVHVALARWWQLPAGQRTPEAGVSLVHRHWQTDGFADQTQADAWRDQAGEWVRSYLRDEITRGDTAREPRGVERTVSVRTNRLAISGRVDRIDERPRHDDHDPEDDGGPTGHTELQGPVGSAATDDSQSVAEARRTRPLEPAMPGPRPQLATTERELVIVDYKTGRSRLDGDDARGSLALALYAMAAERTLHQRCRRVELHHLPTGTVAAFEHTDETLAQHLRRAEQAALDIMAAQDTVEAGADPDEVFEPVTGPGCSWCDYRRLCPAGQAASRPRESWAGLGELDAARN